MTTIALPLRRACIAAARIARMAGRDVIGFCALIVWYVGLLALGLTLAFAFFPE